MLSPAILAQNAAVLGAPLFDPATLSPTFWYDPSDLTTMRQGSTVGSTAAAYDAVVGYLGDKSGNGNQAIQATGANQPVLKNGSGKSWLLFDGSDSLASADFSAAMHESFSVALAVVIDTVGTVRGNHNIFVMDRINPYLIGQHFATDKLFVNLGSDVQVGSALAAATPYVVVVTWAGASTTVRINGTQTTINPGTSGFGLVNAIVGAAGGNAGASVIGKIYGVIGRDDPFDATQTTNVESYLKAKSGASF